MPTPAALVLSNGICEVLTFNGTVRDEADNDYGGNYLRAEAIIRSNRVLPAAWRSRAGQGILYVGAPADCRAD